MTTADDVLFAPLHASVAAKPTCDFQCRRCSTNSASYDWKPFSDRALEWCSIYWGYFWGVAKKDHDGWINNFSHSAGYDSKPHHNKIEWNEVLLRDNFVFEII